jgi:hypothetical protein
VPQPTVSPHLKTRDSRAAGGPELGPRLRRAAPSGGAINFAVEKAFAYRKRAGDVALVMVLLRRNRITRPTASAASTRPASET